MTRLPLKKPLQKQGGLSQFLQPKNKRTPRKTLIYGNGGVGKSRWSNQFDGPIFWVTDPGLGTLECRKLPRSKTYEEFMDWIPVIRNNVSEFQTLVVDSLGPLEQLIWKHTCERFRTKDNRITKLNHISDAGYGAGYVQAMQYWEPFFQFLDELNEEHGKGIVLIAHARPDIAVNTDTEDSLKMMPAVYKHVQNRLDQWCDEIFYAYMPTFTRSEERDGKIKVKGTKSVSERLMCCIGCGCWMAKNRLDLPLEIEFSYDVYKQHVDSFYERNNQ